MRRMQPLSLARAVAQRAQRGDAPASQRPASLFGLGFRVSIHAQRACSLPQGGRVGTGKAGVSLRTVERYDPAEGSWREVAAMCMPRASFGASALGAGIYAVGGQSDRTTHATVEVGGKDDLKGVSVVSAAL